MKTRAFIAYLACLASCEKQQTSIPPPPDNSAEIDALRKQVQELTRKLDAISASTPAPNPKPTPVSREARLIAARQRASRALLMAPREDQLKAALSARTLQDRGGKPMTAEEFQFYGQDTKRIIYTYVPDLLPPELLK